MPKLIYLAHPFSFSEENLRKATKLIEILGKENHIFSPLHYYHDLVKIKYLPEDIVLERCLDLMRRCDEVWFGHGWQRSKGCQAEHKEALNEFMVIKYLDVDGTFKE